MDEREQQAAIDRAAQHLRRRARLYERDFCPGLARDFRFAADKLDPPAPPLKEGDWVKDADGQVYQVLCPEGVSKFDWTAKPGWTFVNGLGEAGDEQPIRTETVSPIPPPKEPKFKVGQWVRTPHGPGRVIRYWECGRCITDYDVMRAGEERRYREDDISPWFAPGTLVTVGAPHLGLIDQSGALVSPSTGEPIKLDGALVQADDDQIWHWFRYYEPYGSQTIRKWAKRLYGQPADKGEGE